MLGSGVTKRNWNKLTFFLTVSHKFGIAYPPQSSKSNQMRVVSPRFHEIPMVMLHLRAWVAYQMSRQRRLISPDTISQAQTTVHRYSYRYEYSYLGGYVRQTKPKQTLNPS